jgi:hypothetical protein
MKYNELPSYHALLSLVDLDEDDQARPMVERAIAQLVADVEAGGAYDSE